MQEYKFSHIMTLVLMQIWTTTTLLGYFYPSTALDRLGTKSPPAQLWLGVRVCIPSLRGDSRINSSVSTARSQNNLKENAGALLRTRN